MQKNEKKINIYRIHKKIIHKNMSKDKKLNNLLGMEDYTEKDIMKKSKTTKRTDVAKDVLEKVEVTGKDVFAEDKMKNKQEIANKKLNNLYSLDEYTEKETIKSAKKTKRTDVAKDVLQEGCGCDKKEKKEKKGLSAKQKKLPKHLQDAILKKQG